MLSVLMYYFTGDEYGRGHWYRSGVLANTLVATGANVSIASNENPRIRDTHFHKVEFGDSVSFARAVNASNPDVVIVDVPDGYPEFINGDFRLIVIDGVGHDNDGDVIVSQGINGKSVYEAPEYLIIDQRFAGRGDYDPHMEWFVFGGYYDKMGLVDRFLSSDREASCVVTGVGDYSTCKHAICYQPVDVYVVASSCKKAAVAMGMTVWELIAMGIKPHVFSYTERHLETALMMEERGWVNAYPKLGVPFGEEFDVFLSSGSSVLNESVVDGMGAYRVADLCWD